MLEYNLEDFRNEDKSVKTERANAKINLYLDIVSRRENGYHDLYTVMQTVSLCDLVTVDFRPDIHTKITMRASGNDQMPLDCRNLAWRAAELLLQTAGRQGEVTITIEKHIPMAAGLAGGSSDAAAVLRGLNHLLGEPLSTEALCALGARLGADIPFCIVGGSSLVTGIGDRLEPIDSMPKCPMVVACQGEGVSTPAAYGKLDTLHDFFTNGTPSDARAERILTALRIGSVEGACVDFYNIFEEVVPNEQPYVNRIKKTMEEGGAIRAMMSGSGPSVFGVFSTVEDAARVCETLRQTGAAAFVCEPR